MSEFKKNFTKFDIFSFFENSLKYSSNLSTSWAVLTLLEFVKFTSLPFKSSAFVERKFCTCLSSSFISISLKKLLTTNLLSKKKIYATLLNQYASTILIYNNLLFLSTIFHVFCFE